MPQLAQYACHHFAHSNTTCQYQCSVCSHNLDYAYQSVLALSVLAGLLANHQINSTTIISDLQRHKVSVVTLR